MEYSIDASALIETWFRDFPPDLFPNVWIKIEKLIDDGVLVASEEVLYEIEKKHDELYEWCLKHMDMFIGIDEKTQEVVREILKNHKKLIDTRKNRSGADPFVIALAIINNLSVITLETESSKPDRPRIPDVCKAFNIRYLNLIDLFRMQGWKF